MGNVNRYVAHGFDSLSKMLMPKIFFSCAWHKSIHRNLCGIYVTTYKIGHSLFILSKEKIPSGNV